MSWETRRNGSYYYRKEWRNGRCVSIYLGSGITAELISRFEAERKQQCAVERKRLRQRLAELQAEDAEADALSAEVEKMASDALIAAGFHCHRGTWRKRRDAKD